MIPAKCSGVMLAEQPNTKKILNNGNITYGKIEENYRKTDGFMAMVSAFTIVEDIENENTELVFLEPIIF